MKTKQMFAVLIMLVATSSMTWAGSTLHIGFGALSDCPTGCGGDPNANFSNNWSIYQNANGALDVATTLLILGVPGLLELGGSDFSGSIDQIVSFTDFGTGSETNLGSVDFIYWTTGLSPDLYNLQANGFFQGRSFPTAPSPSQDIYTFLGLTGNNSNHLSNWTNDTSFNIFIFAINANLGGGDLFDILFFDDALPLGTHLVAYGAAGNPDIFGTPFTESGLQTPEPTSLLLLGTGLLGLGRICRKKQKKT